MSVLNTFAQKDRMQAVFCRPRKLFFVGIGGVGMHALALAMRTRGHLVSGCDRAPSAAVLSRLAEAGIHVDIGQDAAFLRDAEVLIYSLAIAEDNPLLLAARRAGIPCFSRADLLGFLMAAYPVRVAVSGMHGKSTVTAMLAAALHACGINPTVLSGAPLDGSGQVLHEGQGDLFVAEACEYRDSFLCLDPTVAVVLNTELEHTDYFHTQDEVRRSFEAFVRGAQTVIFPSSPLRIPLTLPSGARTITFGREAHAYVRADGIAYHEGRPSFDLHIGEKRLGRFELQLLGEHNAENALAAIAAALACGADAAVAASAVATFSGTPMRLEKKGVWGGILLYADYAHHPTEIRASLASLRRVAKEAGGRLFCLFQPHTYSRTASFFCDFADALSAADRVILLDIYAAREKNVSGVSSEVLANALPNGVFARDFSVALSLLRKEARQGDVAVVMGAGDIHRIFSLL